MNNKTLRLVVFCFCSLLIFSFFVTTSQSISIEISTVIDLDTITGNKPEIHSFTSQISTTLTIAQKDARIYPFSSDFLDWGVDDIDAEIVFGGYDGATNIGGDYTGAGIKIAILDSGIDKKSGSLHADFTDRIVNEHDFYYDDSNANDEWGHGTHCAGVAGANDNNFGIIGAAPESEFLIARVMDAYGNFVYRDRLIEAINWSVSNGADVISMSWGSPDELHPDVYTALRNAYDSGVVLVAASGNADSYVRYPANYSEVISVGAISQDHTRAGYPDWGWQSGEASCYGPGLDVVAPGTAIYSCWINNGYNNKSGTSMACPHVAGLCALILEAQSILTPFQVKDVLRMTATDLGPEGMDDYYGFGEVNAPKAIDASELYFTDSDGDDLTDAYEKYYYNTNRFDSDTDDDGLSDYDEVFVYLTDPADYDMDDDGLSDREELLIYDTNPGIYDTDNDGLNDGDEVNTYNTDPLDDDSDNDYLEDGEEIQIGTDPNDEDTDNDGMGDWIENSMGTNPLVDDADEDPDSDGLTNYEELMVYHTLPFDDDTDNGGKEDGWEVDRGKNPLDPGDDNGGWIP